VPSPTVIRVIQSERGPSGDAQEGAILDAARSCVLEFGVRRTTLTEVARRAGVSRPTVYRRWPDVRSLLADLLTRELAGLVARTAPPSRPGRPARDALVDHVTAAVAAMRENDLLGSVVALDADLLLPYLVERLGMSQRAVLVALEGYLRAGQADGSVRPGDPAAQSRAILLTYQAFALSGGLVADVCPPDRLDEELRALIDRYLRPEAPGGVR